MNKSEAKKLVADLTAASLRRIAYDFVAWGRFAGWPKDLSTADRAVITAEFEELARRVSEKEVK